RSTYAPCRHQTAADRHRLAGHLACRSGAEPAAARVRSVRGSGHPSSAATVAHAVADRVPRTGIGRARGLRGAVAGKRVWSTDWFDAVSTAALPAVALVRRRPRGTRPVA